MITTILFGIPGAPFAAVVIGLLVYLNIELGDPSLFYDDKLFSSMILGFLGATIIVFVILLACLKQICYITSIPFKYYFPFLTGLIVWSCVQHRRMGRLCCLNNHGTHWICAACFQNFKTRFNNRVYTFRKIRNAYCSTNNEVFMKILITVLITMFSLFCFSRLHNGNTTKTRKRNFTVGFHSR